MIIKNIKKEIKNIQVPGSLPDIDIDVMPSCKDKVKGYISEKYGCDQFTHVGTFTTLALKGTFKELCRLHNIEFQEANYLSSILDFEDKMNGGEFLDIFKNCIGDTQSAKLMKNFVSQHPELINDIQLILGSPKSASIHACAVIVVPSDNDIYNYMPLRWATKDDDTKILVSEIQGEDLADSGFLKNDILVIEQLDKYSFCLNLIKETTGKDIDIYNLPLDEKGVYELFQKGYCSDIFQFGSRGLTGYLKELQPYNIDELVDATALYRPGPMATNSNNEYVLRKFGKRDIEYSYGLKEVTKKTKGLWCYQEQIMQACRVLGNFTLVDADDIRKAIVKKRPELIKSYKDQFIKGALSNGCPEDEAAKIWDELEIQGTYCFNKSHAVSYTLISYVGQWLKYHYPIQFWTTALQYAKDEIEIAQYINEIYKLESIKVIPPDINYSGVEFHTEYKKGEIYWSISKIKFLGDVAVEAIIKEREANGNFFSFDEFFKRVEKRKVNKRIVINLILSGAFDNIEDIKVVTDRIKLINRYYKLSLTKVTDISKDEILNSPYNNREYYWILKQKELTGFGLLEYGEMFKYLEDLRQSKDSFVDSNNFFSEKNENKTVVIAGVIRRIVVRTNKKGEYCQIELDSNNESTYVTVWSEQFGQFKHRIVDNEGKIAFIRGLCKFDTYKSTQVIQSGENFLIETIN